MEGRNAEGTQLVTICLREMGKGLTRCTLTTIQVRVGEAAEL